MKTVHVCVLHRFGPNFYFRTKKKMGKSCAWHRVRLQRATLSFIGFVVLRQFNRRKKRAERPARGAALKVWSTKQFRRTSGCMEAAVRAGHACTRIVSPRPWINARRIASRRIRPYTHTRTYSASHRLIGLASSRRTNLFTMYTVGSNGRGGTDRATRDTRLYSGSYAVSRPRAASAENRIASTPAASTSLLSREAESD